MRWARWLCSLKFTLNLAMSTEFGACATAQRESGEVGPYGNCAFLLDLNDVDINQNGRDAGILVGLYFGFQLLAYVFLVQKANGNLY